MCKPSSMHHEGDRVSNPTTDYAYLCKGAIAITRNSPGGKFMLYDLGTGQDVVRLNEGERVDNVFKVGDGNKNFHGNAGDDTFVLIGPCSSLTGLLDGKGFRDQGNSLILEGNCLRWQPITVDLRQQILFLGTRSVPVRNIHRVFGRKDQSDTIHTSCSSKLVAGGGGRSASEPDYIIVNYCSSFSKTTVFVEGYTDLKVINFSNGNLAVLLKGKVEFRAQIPRRFGGTFTFQFKYVGSLTSAHIDNTGTEFVLGFDNGGSSKFQFRGNQLPPRTSSTTCEPRKETGNQISVLISFNSKLNLQLSYNLDEGRVQCLYNLEQEGGGGFISGYGFMDNVFQLKSGHWNVYGGTMTNDNFILIRSDFPGIVDGRSGQNTLSFGNDLSEDLNINLKSGFITGRVKIPIMNIQRVVGRDGFVERVTVGCSTNFLDLGGVARDTVEIPLLPCSVNLTISVKGKALIAGRSPNGTVVVLGGYESKSGCSKTLPLELALGGESIVLMLNFPIKMVHLASSTFLEIDGGHKITFYPGKFPHVYFEEDSGLKSTLIEEEGRVFAFHEISGTGSGPTAPLRQGSSAIPNIFKLEKGSNWTILGGSLDDTFILTEGKFQGKIHGMGGVNALKLPESDNSSQVSVNLQRKTLTFSNKMSLISFDGIQTVVGRTGKQDVVVCACDTKIVMLEGGGTSYEAQDRIEILDGLCHPTTSFVIEEFTQVVNKASRGNFTYHVKTTSKSYDINYHPTNYSTHNFKFELPLDQIKNVTLAGTSLEIGFITQRKTFPLNFHNLPTFQIVEGQELLAELILEVDRIPKTSVMARAPFSGSIFGLNGAENGIVVQTSTRLQSIIGGDKDDTIIVSQVKSVLLINGGDGTNRLQFSEELYRNQRLEVDFPNERVSFLEDKTSFVTILRGITLFNGRKSSLERVILGCDTKGVKFVEEVIVRSNCVYNVRIEIGARTRVIFDVGHDREPGLRTQVLDETEHDEEVSELNALERDHEDDDEWMEVKTSTEKELEKLAPSTFYYHFSTIKSFDIEVDSFSRLSVTKHIFYLNFALSDLSSLRFSLNDSRLVYSTLFQQGTEYSHLVAEVEPSEMFYSQPEFMTAEGFLLRISRYGEIIAVVANPQEHIGMEIVQQEVIPRLSTYSSQLGISFMLETGSEFIYCGCPGEINLLTNRENVTSHLVGFNQTTYEILDLDNDVFIYPQLVQNDSVHVLDLSDIIFQIRNLTRHKYVPEVAQIGNNLEIRMTNWTDLFPGKVILVDGISSISNFAILLNSIAMEILPVGDDEDPLPVTDSGVGNRQKRSVGADMGTNLAMKPRPISIPEGHVYLLAAADLEDGVVVRKGTAAGDDNSTFEYSQDEDDLIITSINTEESGKSTGFIIFDYYAPSTLVESNDDHNGTLAFGKVETVNGIHVKLGKEAFIITSNEPIVSEETGEEIKIEFYEDILDREEAEIVKGIPDMPRKFKVSWMRKIGRTAMYRNAAWGVILGFTLFIGILIWTFFRKRPATGKYSLHKLQSNQFQDKNEEEIEKAEYRDRSGEDDCEEPEVVPVGSHWNLFCRKRGATGKYSPHKLQTKQSQDENGQNIELLEYRDRSNAEEEFELVPVNDLTDDVHSHSE